MSAATEPSALRYAILQQIDQHERTGSNAYLDDDVIASRLNAPLDDVQRQMIILGNRKLIELLSAFGPKYVAALTPTGTEALEAASPQPPTSTTRTIGF